ncbi:MAG: methyltransferase domain-containing protein [candidate division Zixibacteria bacterium]|nr:methyltransferase domain-containing protein [candidate division Zixibacteria bacterium]
MKPGWLVGLNRRLMSHTETDWQTDYVMSAYTPERLAFYRERLAQTGLSLKDSSVLDVGCGPGQWLKVCAEEQPARLVGGDYSREMLASVRRLGVEKLGVRLFYADALAIPVKDERFDLVIASLLISYVPSDYRLIGELARVCRPGGRVLIGFHGLGLYLHYVFSERKFKYLAVLPVSWLSFLTGQKLLWNTYQTLPRIIRMLNAHNLAVENVHHDWFYMGCPYIVYVVAKKKHG